MRMLDGIHLFPSLVPCRTLVSITSRENSQPKTATGTPITKTYIQRNDATSINVLRTSVQLEDPPRRCQARLPPTRTPRMDAWNTNTATATPTRADRPRRSGRIRKNVTPPKMQAEIDIEQNAAAHGSKTIGSMSNRGA